MLKRFSTRNVLSVRLVLALLLAGFLSSAVAAPSSHKPAPIDIVFFAGGHEDNEFWRSMTAFAQAVAEDLDINLRVIYPDVGAFGDDGRALVSELDAGTYFISVYHAGVTGELLQMAEERRVRTLLINSDVFDAEREQIGQPREKFAHWIGHIHPDDVQAGYQVADEIIARFERPEAVHIIAFNGDEHVQADVDRQAGLRQRLSESPGVSLLAVEQADWSAERARTAAEELLQAHPQANAVWAASDPMALGAAAAFASVGRSVVAASVDWTAQGLEAVRTGQLQASVGGHFMEAGIALLLIYDYHQGRDFSADPGVRFSTPMHAINQGAIDAYLEKVGSAPDWSRIDFTQFTKTHNPGLERYDFSWPRVEAQL